MRVIRLAARWGLIGAATLYALGLIGLLALWATWGQQTWWLALANVFAVYLFAPLLLLAPAALLVRSRWLRGATLVALAIFLGLFGGRLLPPPATRPAAATLRVMTLNELASNDSYDALVAAIRAQHADVVALQELPAGFAAVARAQLGDEYPYQLLAPAEWDVGLGLLSRYPLRQAAPTTGFAGQRVVLDVRGRPITLINVHLTAPEIKASRPRTPLRLWVVRGYDTARRAHEYDALLQLLDATPGPLVLLGDFNTGDREPPYARLAARMHDVYRETGWGFGFTFPSQKRFGRLTIPFPLVRIDYVWSRGGVAPEAARVSCDSGGSDHCMIVADLRQQ